MLPFAIPAALSRVPWKLVCVGLLLLALAVQTARVGQQARRADRAEFNLREARETLRQIAEQSRAQQAEIARKIPQVVERVRDNPAARRVENAPLPGNCRTPSEIMEAPL